MGIHKIVPGFLVVVGFSLGYCAGLIRENEMYDLIVLFSMLLSVFCWVVAGILAKHWNVRDKDLD